MRLPRARRIPTAIHVNHPPGPERAADPGRLGANHPPGPERAADPRRLGANHPPRPERAADPRRLGANRRPGPEPVAGSPPTRSFGSPQGEKVAKPHIDLRHRLRIHDSGDVDDPFARYGPRLLGHGVRRTTQNELRPPQQNVIRPTAADRRCRDDDCKRIRLLETEVPGDDEGRAVPRLLAAARRVRLGSHDRASAKAANHVTRLSRRRPRPGTRPSRPRPPRESRFRTPPSSDAARIRQAAAR